MIARAKEYQTVAEVMDQQGIELGELVASTGVQRRVIEAIVHQRYTPSPEQRRRVSDVLGVTREGIIWGHRTPVEDHIHAPI